MIANVEHWKPVVGFEKVYSVSDLGRIRRETIRNGSIAGRILQPRVGAYPYLTVELSDRPRIKRDAVHRIVAAAFLGPCPVGKQVNHRNGIKTDNRVENLEYVTGTENIRHARDILGKFRGENNHRAKFTESLVLAIRDDAASGMLQREIADKRGIKRSAVADIMTRRAWGHVRNVR